MEVGHDAHRHGFEVSSATRLRTDPDPLSLYDLPGAPHKESLDFKRVESSDPYHSDGEVSSTGETDTSHGTVLSPFTVARTSRAIGVDEDLTHEVGAEVFDLSDFGSIPKFIEDRIDNGFEVASFLVTNLATVMQQFKQWKAELPMVEPFYAVKCNPDPAIVRLLAHLGCSFDCATMGEIDMVVNGLGEDLSFGARGKVSRSLVYANPAKMAHMLEFAIKSGVRMTVFDGEDELHKIAAIPGHESLQLLLRLTTDDKASICRFSKKFGCPVAEAPYMLKVAKDLGLNIAGVSFHVGSGCGDPAAYTTAIEHAAMVFEEGRRLGFQDMHIVDIGGGFPGDTSGYGGANMPTFQDLAAAIREAITHFSTRLPDLPENMRFIAEPGRYFVSASTTVATKVYSRKGGHNNYQALYVDDGVYGTFNNVIYDHATPAPQRLQTVLHGKQDKVELLPTAVFGPTCDGIDQMCSLESTQLPRCEVGDWLIWENMGAYTHTASFVFNGYTHIPKKTYVYL